MDVNDLPVMKEVHRKEIDRLLAAGEPPLPKSPTIHHTELPELAADNPYYRPWNTYRRLVSQLVTDGLEGIVIAINGDSILGYYPNSQMASWVVANEIPRPGELILIKQIKRYEDNQVLQRLKSPCPNSPMPLAKTA